MTKIETRIVLSVKNIGSPYFSVWFKWPNEERWQLSGPSHRSKKAAERYILKTWPPHLYENKTLSPI